jgi:hypothetical protein
VCVCVCVYRYSQELLFEDKDLMDALSELIFGLPPKQNSK